MDRKSSRAARHRFVYFRAMILLGFGLAYALLIPPFEAPDEPAHFARAYGIAEGQFILKDHPRELVLLIVDTFQKWHGHRDLPIFREIKQLLVQHDDRIPNVAFNTSHYSPIPYVLHAAAIRLVMTFTGPRPDILWTLYICRIVSLLLFVCMMAAAFQACPYLSWPIFWVVATPMALSQASIVSADYIIYCASAVLLSVSLGPPGASKYTWLTALSVFFLLVTKVPYAAILLVPAAAAYFAQPGERRRRFKVLIWAGICGSAAVFLWNYVAKTHGILDFLFDAVNRYRFGGEVDPSKQFWMTLSNPVRFFDVVWLSLKEKAWVLWHQFVGVLGWLQVPIPYWAAVLWTVCVPATILVSDRAPHSKYRESLALGLTCFTAGIITMAVVITTLYLIWMPVGAARVNMQGRYFHPVALCLLAGFSLMRSFDLSDKYRRAGELCLLVAIVVVHGASISAILQKYWQ